MKRLLLTLLLACCAVSVAAQKPRLRVVVLTGGGGGGGGSSLIAQHLHPRMDGLSAATAPTIAAKINAYYDSDPVTSYADTVGTFGAFVSAVDAQVAAAPSVGSPNSTTNNTALTWAPAMCEIATLLPYLTTGGGTGISPGYSAAAYGAEGARLLDGLISPLSLDPNFPTHNYGVAYDWCYNFMSSGQRTAAQGLLDDHQAECEGSMSDYYKADQHKHCSLSIDAALAMAGDGGETWATAHIAEYGALVESLSTGYLGEESVLDNLYKSTSGYGSCGSSGFAYDSYMHPFDMLVAEAYRFAATTQTRAQFYDTAKYSWLPSAIYCWVYNTRPWARTVASGVEPNDLQWFLIRNQFVHDDQMDPNDIENVITPVFAAIWNSVEAAPAQLAMWYTRQRLSRQPPTSGGVIANSWIYRFAMEDPTIAESGPDDLSLPLSAHFAEGFVFRSAWDGDASTGTESVLKIILPDFSAPGNGREAKNYDGAFEIHRKGPQMIWRSGGAHSKDAHGIANTVYFLDTSRSSAWTSGDDWGQKSNGRPLGWANQPQPTSRGADIVQDGAKDYYPTGTLRNRFASGNVKTDYVYADRKNSYACSCFYTSTDNPAVESAMISQYISWRSPTSTAVRLAVYHAYTNTSNQYEPTFAWNPSTDSITVDGTTAAGFFHAPATNDGHLKTTNSHILTASNTYSLGGSFTTSGRNTLTIVQPSSATVVIAGGPDSSGGHFTFADSDGGWDELDVPNAHTSLEKVDIYGFRHTHDGCNASDNEIISQCGQYVAHIQPTSIPNGAAGAFLLFQETDDSGSTAAAVTALTSLTNFVGFQWRDSDMNGLAVFGAAGADQTSGAFTVPTAGTYAAVISNLSGSSRTFAFGGSCGSATNLADGDTDLTFAVDTASKSITMTIITTGSNCAITVS